MPSPKVECECGRLKDKRAQICIVCRRNTERHKRNSVVWIDCKKCGSPTRNEKFCSHSCSASFNNMGVRKHGSNTTICKCGGSKDLQATQCHQCYRNQKHNAAQALRLGDLLISAGHPSYARNVVRKYARQFMEFWKVEKVCECCGYNKHVECCHIKAISEFDEDDLIGDVNARDNLVYLCRNHHWEQEHGYLHL